MDNAKELFNRALGFMKRGWSVIPVRKDKIPYIAWREFQTRFASEEEILKWIETYPDMQLGIVTGKISDLTVVDIEKGGDPSFLPQDTLIVHTGGNGYHYYFSYEPGVTNKARIKELVDIRSEGGYVVAPDSVSEKGKYEIIQEARIIPFPKELFPEKVNIWNYPSGSNKTEIKTELQDYPGYGSGQRNDEMTKYIGYVITQFHPADWDTKVWTIIESANQKNKPPLGLNELRNSFESVKKIERRNNPLGRIYGRNSEVAKEQQEEEKILVLGTEEDKIKHISTVAKESNLDVTDFYKLEMPCFDEALGGGVNIGDVVVIAGQTGNGKCVDYQTPILMFDGKVKKAIDIKENDLLMGPDSKPRRVTGLIRGIDDMFKINQVNGDSYIVNSKHILSLKESKTNKILNIPLNEYLNKSNYFKHLYKGWKTSVDWEYKKVSLDPYLLGIWLGDGSSLNSAITNVDKEVIRYLKDYSIKNKLSIKNKEKRTNFAPTWLISKGKNKNTFLEELHNYSLLGNKHIPIEYKINSREIRLKVLAGLLDTDGFLYSNNCFEITTKSEKLKDDIVFLSRSLGFRVHSVYKKSVIKKINFEGFYHRITITGDTDCIPTKVERKKAKKRLQIKNSLNTGISVEKIGKGKYCGFELDKDGLFILGDFTVTHNTSLAQDWSMSLTRGEKSLKSLWFSYEVLPQHLWNKFKEMGATEEDYLFTPAKNTTGNVEWIENKIKEGKELYGTRAVFIDHLGFLLPKTNGILGKNLSSNYSSFITQIVRDLKTIAKNQEVIIFLPVHMKKAETRSRSSDLDDIKDSSGISQESDAVFLIERERNTNKDATDYYTDVTKITLAKNRKTGKTVVAKFNMLNGRFAYSQLNEEELKVKNNYERLSSLDSDDDD